MILIRYAFSPEKLALAVAVVVACAGALALIIAPLAAWWARESPESREKELN